MVIHDPLGCSVLQQSLIFTLEVSVVLMVLVVVVSVARGVATLKWICVIYIIVIYYYFFNRF